MIYLLHKRNIGIIALIVSVFCCSTVINAQYCPQNNSNITVCYKTAGSIGALEFLCSQTNDKSTIAILINEVTGGSGNYTVNTIGGSDGQVSTNQFSTGEGFIYSFSAEDYLNNRIGFIISDGNSNVPLDADITNSLSSTLFADNCDNTNCPPYFINRSQSVSAAPNTLKSSNLIKSTETIPSNRTIKFESKKCISLNGMLSGEEFKVPKSSNFEASINTGICITQ